MSNHGVLTLGIDLDGVVADYNAFFKPFVAQALGLDLADMPEQETWSFSEAGWGIRDQDHFGELHKEAVLEARMFANMPMVEGASDVLWELSDAGVWNRIVTHRLCVNWGHQIAVADTIAWLDEPRPDGRPRIPYRDLCFIGEKPDVGVDMMVDDAPHNVEQMRLAIGADNVIVFDTPYNREVPGLRARNWYELRDIVMARVEALRAA